MMSVSILIILLAGLAGYLYRQEKGSLARYRRSNESLTAAYGALHERLRTMRLDTAQIKRTLEEIEQLYDITREISRSLDAQKVYGSFAERVKRFPSVTDCAFLRPDEETRGYERYRKISVAIGKDPIGTLMLAGVAEEDAEKVHILTQQFQLAMKQATLYEKVEELATHDSLTHVFTRRYWFIRSAEELARSQRLHFSFSLLMVDIDRFKECNDHYGHLVGDAILVEVARIIRENIRQVDLLGKYGGEEFCLLLTESDARGALFTAQRIRQAIEDARIRAYDEELRVTISIGIAEFPSDGKDLYAVIDKADQALYRAKATGRNKVCVAKEIQRH